MSRKMVQCTIGRGKAEKHTGADAAIFRDTCR